MAIPKGVTNFRDLVRWIIKNHHDGSPYRMAKALHVSPALPFHWRNQMVQRPSMENMLRLCEVYGFDEYEIWRLLKPDTRKRPRNIAPIAGGSSDAQPLPGEETCPSVSDVLRLIRIVYAYMLATGTVITRKGFAAPRAWCMVRPAVAISRVAA